MFTKLLVPLDGTAESAAALLLARALALATHAEMVLLRAIPTSLGLYARRDSDEAADYLVNVAHELEGTGIEMTTADRLGSHDAGGGCRRGRRGCGGDEHARSARPGPRPAGQRGGRDRSSLRSPGAAGATGGAVTEG